MSGFTPGGRIIIWNALEGSKIGDLIQTGDKLRMACLYPPQKSPDEARIRELFPVVWSSHSEVVIPI